MTDARIPERWLSDRRLLRLSDSTYRTFITMLVWSVANRSDGVIDDTDLDLLPGSLDVDDKTIQDLVTAGLLGMESVAPKRWRITEYAATQTSSSELEVLENVRRRDREKKARQRAAAAAKGGDVPGDVPGDASPGTAQDRTGRQDRQAGALEGEPPTADQYGMADCSECNDRAKVGPDGRCSECAVKATSLRVVSS